MLGWPLNWSGLLAGLASCSCWPLGRAGLLAWLSQLAGLGWAGLLCWLGVLLAGLPCWGRLFESFFWALISVRSFSQFGWWTSMVWKKGILRFTSFWGCSAYLRPMSCGAYQHCFLGGPTAAFVWIISRGHCLPREVLFCDVGCFPSRALLYWSGVLGDDSTSFLVWVFNRTPYKFNNTCGCTMMCGFGFLSSAQVFFRSFDRHPHAIISARSIYWCVDLHAFDFVFVCFCCGRSCSLGGTLMVHSPYKPKGGWLWSFDRHPHDIIKVRFIYWCVSRTWVWFNLWWMFRSVFI